MTPASRRGCRLTESGLCWTVATRSTPVGIRNYSPSRPTAWSRSSERWRPGDRDRGDAAVTHTTDQEHLAAQPPTVCPALVASPSLLRDELGCARRPPPASPRYRL